MKPEIKKMLILNAPYLIFVYAFDKIGQAFRLAPGADLTGKLLSIGDGFSAAFSNALPSFDPIARKNGLDYNVKKIENGKPPTYLVSFKGKDIDVMTEAFAP